MWRLADSQHGSDQVVQRPGQVLPGDQDNLVIDAKMADRPSPNRAVGRQDGQGTCESSSHGPVAPDAAVSTIRRRMAPSGPTRVTTTLISSVCPLQPHFGRHTTTMAACGHAGRSHALLTAESVTMHPQPSHERCRPRQSRREGLPRMTQRHEQPGRRRTGKRARMVNWPGLSGTELPFLALRVGFLPNAGVAPAAGGVGLAGTGSAGECRATAEEGRGR